MKYLEKIIKIRAANAQEKLVIFIGAGVSKNSGLPDWNELIKTFATELGYDACKNCANRNSCKKENEQCKFQFSQDEYLKIPQYFWDMDTSENHEEYKRLITKILVPENKPLPNYINHKIFDLFPKYIVTTNFDELLELTENHYRRFYGVVSSDSDLFTTKSQKLILKMHGTISNTDSLVLKESDYIDYSKNYAGIETFLKSLLLHHTFLFIGYSVSDYNFKQILNWILHLKETVSEPDTCPQHFITSISDDNSFMEKYLEKYNIHFISKSEMESSLNKDNSSDEPQKLITCFLDTIIKEDTDVNINNLENILAERLEVFKDFNYCAMSDILKRIPRNSLYKISNVSTAFIFPRELNNLYLQLQDILSGRSKKKTTIKKVFSKSGVDTIYCKTEDGRMVSVPQLAESLNDVFFKLYLDNEYQVMQSMLSQFHEPSNQNLAFHILIGNEEKAKETILSFRTRFTEISDFEYVVFKCNEYLFYCTSHNSDQSVLNINKLFESMPNDLQSKFKFLDEIFSNEHAIVQKLQNLLIKHEKMYRKKMVENVGYNFGKLYNAQSLVYDYYFYFKKNNLALDRFANFRLIAEPYIQMILCTYIEAENKNLPFSPLALERYFLNEYDVDILLKFCKTENLTHWLDIYKIYRLEISCPPKKLLSKFRNLLNSVLHFPDQSFNDYLNNFMLLFSRLDLSRKNYLLIEDELSIFCRHVIDTGTWSVSLSKLFLPLFHYYKFNPERKTSIVLKELLNKELCLNVSTPYYADAYNKLIELLAEKATPEIKQKFQEFIESGCTKQKKIKLIYVFRKLIPKGIHEQVSDFVIRNLHMISPYELFMLVADDIIENIPKFSNRLTTLLDSDAWSHHSLVSQIETVLWTYLFGYDIDITRLTPFVNRSEFVKYVLDPDNFDYSSVDMADPLWGNFYENKKFKNYFIDHRNELMTDRLKKQVEQNLLNENQKKFVYKYLLDE